MQSILVKIKNFMVPFLMDGVKLSEGYRTTTRRQFTFYYLVLQNDEGLN